MSHSPIKIEAEVEGYFTFYAYKRDSRGREIRGTRRKLAEFKNLITNTGLNALLTPDVSDNQDFGFWCAIGSGNQTPTVTDTQLQSYLQHVGANSSGNNGKPSELYTRGYAPDLSYTFYRWGFRFADGYAAFNNIQEVAIYSRGTETTPPYRPNVMGSRALILDQVGQPTSIAVQPDETLDIYYEIRFYPPTDDVTGSIVLNGVSYPYTIRPIDYNATQYNAWCDAVGNSSGLLGFFRNNLSSAAWASNYYGYNVYVLGDQNLYPRSQIASSLGSSNEAPQSVTKKTYVANSFQRAATILFNLQHGNIAGGIGSLLVSTYLGAYKITFTGAKVPKNNNFKWSQDVVVSLTRR